MYATPLDYPPIVGAWFILLPGVFPGVSKNEVALFFGISNQENDSLSSFFSDC